MLLNFNCVASFAGSSCFVKYHYDYICWEYKNCPALLFTCKLYLTIPYIFVYITKHINIQKKIPKLHLSICLLKLRLVFGSLWMGYRKRQFCKTPSWDWDSYVGYNFVTYKLWCIVLLWDIMWLWFRISLWDKKWLCDDGF